MSGRYDTSDCNCGFQEFGEARSHQPNCPYRIRVQDGGSAIPDSADLDIVPNITPALEVKITKIIPIAPGSKYVILIPQNTDSDQLTIMQTQLGEWWASDEPFLLAGDQFKFVKVDEHSTIPELASCGYEKCPGHEPGSGETCEVDVMKGSLK